MASLLEVSHLSAGYGLVEVLHDVDLHVEHGEIVVVLGANGAGKTTTMRAISGTISRRGSLAFDGHDIARRSPESIVGLGLAHVPQGRGTFPDLTVRENLQIGAHTRRDRDVQRDINRWFEVFPRLGERRAQPAGSLSGGEQQMLAVARALMCRPRLLLCDEPTLGLAPLIVRELFDTLQRVSAEDGLAVLLVEQNANLALRIARRAYVLESGLIVAQSGVDSILADDTLRRAYLG